MIELMKASAGSGKTFNLARKYITLLFKKEDRYAYRHILAVTFTNKATDEMKSRILKELFILSSSPEKSGYLKYFMPWRFSEKDLEGIRDEDFVRVLPGKPDQEITLGAIADSATTLLCDILHDYSAFAVSTIDRFFQQTLRAFSREIGQFASYQVELDKNSLVTESVDRVLDSLTESDKSLLSWLTDSVMESIELGGKYSLEGSLVAMASRLKSDEHRMMAEKSGIDESMIYSKGNLSRIRKTCADVMSGFEAKVIGKASEALDILIKAGVSPADSNRGFLKALYVYAELSPGDTVEAPSDSFMAKAADPDQWFSKAKSATLKPKVHSLEAPLADFRALFGQPYKEYCTARILREQLYSLGVAGELYREFNALMKEKNVLSIDDSNTILKDIIDGCDAPFVYEKLGVRFENFLLDEFQDTSRIQWDNFRPLLGNSDSQGFDNLIVGDVKQSIYRWRGSDWNLFHSELQEEFDVRLTDLDTNYRSLRDIVDFNNVFFAEAAGLLDRQYGSTGMPSVPSISSIYSGVAQKVPDKGREGGVVDVTFCPKEEEKEAVLRIIGELEEKGVPRKDIAVLVRSNASGAEISSYLIENGVDVLTDDSLKVKSSVSVRRVVSLLHYADNPSDSINGYLARSLDIPECGSYHSLVDLCESLVRGVRDCDPDTFGSEVLYVQSFMDCVQDFVSVNGNDLHAFLKSWEDMDPSISSPEVSGAVRVMTIHKSKGLDFPYVIFPYVESVTLFKSGYHWCVPDLRDTGLSGCAEGLYDVYLSSKALSTLFSRDYLEELRMQYVDNINTVYVAFTRAARGLFLVGKTPSASVMSTVADGGVPVFSDFSQIVYWFLRNGKVPVPERKAGGSVPEGHVRFSNRDIPECSRNGKSAGGISPRVSGYPSWPLNPESTGDGSDVQTGRLSLSTDSADFFSEDGKAGISASHRLRGVVLHDILSQVKVPSDLRMAVERAQEAGYLSPEEAGNAFGLLSGRIDEVMSRGWFPDDRRTVRTEVTLIDSDGSLYRPDRVVTDGGRVTVVDYKFGEHHKGYVRQIKRYADIYRRMGYAEVSAYLWYVMSGEVVGE